MFRYYWVANVLRSLVRNVVTGSTLHPYCNRSKEVKMSIPDHLFDEGINNTLLHHDMRHVMQNKSVYEKTQRDYVSTVVIIIIIIVHSPTSPTAVYRTPNESF